MKAGVTRSPSPYQSGMTSPSSRARIARAAMFSVLRSPICARMPSKAWRAFASAESGDAENDKDQSLHVWPERLLLEARPAPGGRTLFEVGRNSREILSFKGLAAPETV